MYNLQDFLKLLGIKELKSEFIKKYRILLPNDIPDFDYDFDSKFKLCIATKLNDKNPLDLTYYQLFHFLKGVYRHSSYFKKGLTFYEYFNASTYDVKPRLDIDKKLYEIFHPKKGQKINVSQDMEDASILEKYVDETLHNIYTILNSLFPDFPKEDYAISKDCRWMKDKNDIDYFKISYHVVLWKKKINFNKFKSFIQQNLNVFKTFQLDDAIDLSIYKGGLTKWRIPMSKKKDKDSSLLVPINYKDYKDFHKHIVTYINDCEELDIEIQDIDNESISTEEDISYNSDAKDFLLRIKDNNKEIEAIKKKYTFIGVPKFENNIECVDIEEYECNGDHTNNHNFLIHDTSKGILKIKCHSSKCKDFFKVLYKPKNNYNEFNVNYFNNIPILEDKDDNYTHCKEYFEHFFKFMRDSNSFYRIDNTYDKRLKYFDRKVKPVKIEGYTDLLYKKKIDGEIKNEKFIERYKNDPGKKSYFDLTFEPYSKDENTTGYEDNNFNLFNGFNYETILTFDEKQDIDESKQDDLKFLLRHIKKYHCSDNDKHFDFLMQFLANIIQYPQNIPQIIMIFYSHTHGCHAKDTPILMYDGSIKKVQDVKVGDVLMGDDSTPRNVRLLARGRQTMCKIIPNKGEEFVCNYHHYLCLKYTPNVRYKRLTIEYMDDNLKMKNKKFKNIKDFLKFKEEITNKVYEVRVDKYLELKDYIRKRFFIYRNEVKFQEKEVFDPYLMGLWLGDGDSDSTGFTNQDSEIIKYLKQNLGKHNLYLQYQESKEYGYRINSVKYHKYGNKMLDILRKYNLIKNKHIPKDYKCNSRQNQLKLLAGLIDTDGHFDKNGKCYEIVQKNEKLIDDIIYLCRSLGFSCYKKVKVINKVNYYRVFINGNKINEIPVLIKRKKIPNDLIRSINKDNLRVGFKVELLEEDEYYGFNLDGNHRFVQGDFIIQRNTGKSQFTRFIAEVIGNGLSFFGSLKQITETHTNAHIGKLINIVEEVDKYSTRQYENIIKDYSQRTYAPYNEKNKQIIQIKTFVRYFFTTNHIDGVYYDNEDRRYCLYTFDKIYDKEHIDRIQKILSDNVIKYLFGQLLANYEVRYTNPNHWNENRYKTQEYYDMMVEDALKSFIKQIYFGEYINIEEEDPKEVKIDEKNPHCLFIHPDYFKKQFKQFCEDNGERKPRIVDVNKKINSTYKEFIESKVQVGRRKMYRFNLFKLGKFLNQEEHKIMNHYNNVRLVPIIEDIKDK